MLEPRSHTATLPRYMIVLVTVSVLINIAVAIAFVVLVSAQARRDTRAAQAQAAVSAAEHDSAITACRGGNANRHKDAAVWAYLLRTPPDATAAQKAEIAHLDGLVSAKDAQQDCAALYSVKPVP